MLKRPAAVKILFAFCLAVAFILAPGVEAQSNSVSLPLEARQLMGMKVENSDAQKVGTVRNLVLDFKTGKLKYAVVGWGGFLGVRATLRLVPSEVLSAATTKRQTLAVNATSSQWNNAPLLKLSSLASLDGANHAREISRYFESLPKSAAMTPTSSLSTTGRTAGPVTNVLQPELKFASDFIGVRVVNQKQEKIGEVMDLLVRFGEPRPAFAIISSGRLFHREHQYAVPLSALNSSADNNKLTLNADTLALQQAQPFNHQVWAASVSNDFSRVYQYSTPDE